MPESPIVYGHLFAGLYVTHGNAHCEAKVQNRGFAGMIQEVGSLARENEPPIGEPVSILVEPVCRCWSGSQQLSHVPNLAPGTWSPHHRT